jgi:hypothetical protein
MGGEGSKYISINWERRKKSETSSVLLLGEPWPPRKKSGRICSPDFAVLRQLTPSSNSAEAGAPRRVPERTNPYRDNKQGFVDRDNYPCWEIPVGLRFKRFPLVKQ